MSGIGFVEGAVDVPAPALHGRVRLTFTIVVFTAFHLKCPIFLPQKEYPFCIMASDNPFVPLPPDPPNPNKELLLAAHRGELDKVKELLDAGADVNYRNEDSLTPLMFAVTGEHLNIVNELVGRGADVTMVDMNGATALHLAAAYGHVDILNKIIDTHMADGDNLNAQDKYGQTALHMAAEGGMVNSVMLLLQKGAFQGLALGKVGSPGIVGLCSAIILSKSSSVGSLGDI